jgi:hypothetical protein
MSRIVLLSCTKSKLDKKSPAYQLYSPSPMFQKTLEYGKSLKPDKMFILSAKYHLVPMNKELEPYDLTLKTMKGDEKKSWGQEVLKQMKSSGLNPTQDKFIFLTGSEYMKPLTDYPNVYFVGDALSARGITVSGAQGIYVAKSLL